MSTDQEIKLYLDSLWNKQLELISESPTLMENTIAKLGMDTLLHPKQPTSPSEASLMMHSQSTSHQSMDQFNLPTLL